MRAGFDIGRPQDVLDNLAAEAATTSPEALLAASVKMLAGARPDWHNQGACKGSDIDFTSRGNKQRAAALQVCGSCPVPTECLAWAIEVDDRGAILGGMDVPARRRLVAQHQAASVEGDSDAAA
jgi:WhiB family redox-sensing transcriptional regulator